MAGRAALPTPSKVSSTDLVLEGHEGIVYVVAVLGDGRIISGSGDKRLLVWSCCTPGGSQPRIETTISGHAGPVFAIAVLADGRVASASYDGSIRVWCIEGSQRTAGCDAVLRLADAPTDLRALALAVLPDGRLVGGYSDSMLRIWQISTKTCVAELSGHTSGVRHICVHPKGGLIISASYDATVRVWDPAAPVQLKLTLTGHTKDVNAVAVLPCGRVVSASSDLTLRIWSVLGGGGGGGGGVGGCDHVLSGHAHAVRSVAVLPDGRIASGSNFGKLRVWEGKGAAPGGGFESYSLATTLLGHADSIRGLVALPGGTGEGKVVSCSEDCTVRVTSVGKRRGAAAQAV